MLFENSFYKVNQEVHTDGALNVSITIDASHDVFTGHFPDNPITPGVVQMEIVKELLSKVTKREMKCVSVGNCKFLAILNPIETPSIDIVLNYALQEDETYKVSTVMSANETTYMKMSSIYQ